MNPPLPMFIILFFSLFHSEHFRKYIQCILTTHHLFSSQFTPAGFQLEIHFFFLVTGRNVLSLMQSYIIFHILTAKEINIEKNSLHLWRVHVDIWQNQYNIAKLKNKKKETNKQKRCACDIFVDLKGKCDRGPAHRHLKLLEGDCQVWRSLA